MPLSVAHLSFSQSGGAGSVAAVLSEAQRVAGRDSRHIWAINSTLRSQPLSAPLHTVAAGIDHYVLRDHNFNAPISLARDLTSWNFEGAVEDVDVIHVHNLNGLTHIGALNRRFPNKKLIWTLHDMNAFTGSCHYTLGCAKYTESCSVCPAVKIPFQGMVKKRFEQKLDDFKNLHTLSLVAPSQWLADAASKSTLLSRFPLEIIENPLDPIFLSTEEKTFSTEFSFVVVAQNLDDPVKDVAAAVQAFSKIHKANPAATMALVGRGGYSLDGSGIRLMGPQSRTELAVTLQSSRALIVPSQAENAPMVMAEAASQGCIPIVRNTGGMPGMIESLGAGRLFEDQQGLEIAMAEELATSDSMTNESRQFLIAQAQKHYSPEAVRKQYDRVYER